MHTISKEQRLMNKTKVGIMNKTNTTFISTILFSLKQTWDKNLSPPTAATDGMNLLIHPDFWCSLTDDQRVGLLLHETWHVCWNHMYRGRDLDKKKYNYAADYVINNGLIESGFTLPPEGLVDKQYGGMSTKQVYDLLEDPPEEDGNKYLDILFDPQGDPNDATQSKQVELTNTLIKAMQQSKMSGDDPGSIPGEIQIMVDELLNPKLPWSTLLQQYITGFVKEDYSYKRPNRRLLPLDIYLPSQHSEKLTEVCIAVDTSCSVSDEEFLAFLSEIQDIKERLKPEKMTILDFDTSIKAEHVIGEYDDLASVTFHGRGGTDVRPVMKWAKKHQPVVMIVFSDMYFDISNSDDPGCPILWISVNNTRHDHLTFGDVIDFEI